MPRSKHNITLREAHEVQRYLKKRMEAFINGDNDVFQFTVFRNRNIHTNQETVDKLTKRNLKLNDLYKAITDSNLSEVVNHWLSERVAFQPEKEDGKQALKVINFLCWSTIGITYCYVIYGKEALLFEVDQKISSKCVAYAISQNRYIDARIPDKIISYFKSDSQSDAVTILADDINNAKSFDEFRKAMEQIQLVNLVDKENETGALHRNRKEHGYDHLMR